MLRQAFTMLELIIVIVITGIIGLAGSKAVIEIMQNYAIQQQYNKLESDSASAIRQLSKYLQDAIWDSIAIKNGNTYTSIFSINQSNLGSIDANRNLVFIEKNQDVINGYFYQNKNIPIFSGFIDMANSKGATLRTLSNTDKLTSLGGKPNNMAIYFPYINTGNNVTSKFYTTKNNRTALFSITSITGAKVMSLSRSPAKIGDMAIITNDTPSIIAKDTNGNVYINNNKNIIIQDVNSINVWTEATTGVLRIRICFNNKIMNFMPQFCKEGVVIK